jgi:cytochrome c
MIYDMTTKMNRFQTIMITVLAASTASSAQAVEGNPARGQRLFGACAQCHSLEPNRSMTGPSLAGLWSRKAGTIASFPRYSPALKSANVVWDDKTLNEFLKDPQHLIPGNGMTFAGIPNTQQRADLLAFLKNATQPGRAGMMWCVVPNLKQLDAEKRVRAISHCGDTYKVTTADGKSRDFWERNLRFKTDVSDEGPQKGAPALVGAGMMGDRADVIFAAPEEISGFISTAC